MPGERNGKLDDDGKIFKGKITNENSAFTFFVEGRAAVGMCGDGVVRRIRRIVYRIRLSGRLCGLWARVRCQSASQEEKGQLINDSVSGDITSSNVHLNKKNCFRLCLTRARGPHRRTPTAERERV